MMSRLSGRLIDEMSHIQQSIDDILTTPIGSRVMRREYGSLLFQLIDQPNNDALILQLFSAIYVALLRWEDRINLSKVAVQQLDAGKLVVNLEGELSHNRQAFSVSLPLSFGAAA